MWKLSVDPTKAPDRPDDFVLEFEKGIPVKLTYEDQGKKTTVTDVVKLFLTANMIARKKSVSLIILSILLSHYLESWGASSHSEDVSLGL